MDEMQVNYNEKPQFQSHIRMEEEVWVRFDREGNTKRLIESEITEEKGYSYRKVHYTGEDKQDIGFFDFKSNEVFKDPEWTVTEDDVKSIDPYRAVVLKRFLKLYPRDKAKRPQFFPSNDPLVSKAVNPIEVPPCLTEMGMFSPKHYKSLFLTQDYQDNGLYHILINQDGRWETDVVDDFIPVYQDTEEPVWGMSTDHPWQLILLKFWAKKNRGYNVIKEGKPMEFIEFFTNTNWKYYNLSKDWRAFLYYYTGKVGNGKFLVKTKNTQQVQQAGLVPNSAGYQITDIQETTGQKNISKQKFVISIRSVLKNRWAGSLSVVDVKVNSVYSSRKMSMRLERDFILNHEDFGNLFSSAYLASRRDTSDYFSSYYLLEVPAGQKHAVYLEFFINSPGFLDFTIKQFESNKISFQSQKSMMVETKSRMESSQYGTASKIPGERYLKTKYMLSYDNSSANNSEFLPNTAHSLPQNSQDQFYKPRYEVYEIEYAKGYNRGDAHFNNSQKGRYILKIKSEKYNQPARYVINFCSNSKFDMKEINLNKKDTSFLLRQSMISICGKAPRISLDRNKKYEEIAFANTFEEIGYGYIACKSRKSNPYNILIEFDPEMIKQEGYSLKNQFKNNREHFAIIVKPGQSMAIVLKKLDLFREKKQVWPPSGISIFRQHLK